MRQVSRDPRLLSRALLGHSNERVVALSTRGSLIFSGSEAGKIAVYDEGERRELVSVGPSLTCFAMREERLLTGDAEGGVRIWDITTWRSDHWLAAPSQEREAVLECAWHKESAVSADPQGFRIYDLRAPSSSALFVREEMESCAVGEAAFAAARGRRLTLFDARELQRPLCILTLGGRITSLGIGSSTIYAAAGGFIVQIDPVEASQSLFNFRTPGKTTQT